MRRPIMAGNWKMNKTWAETVVLTQGISNSAKGNWDEVDIVVFPATCNLKAAYSVIEFDNAPVAVGAQNVHWEASGAYTGDVSIPMLEDIGVTYAIVGHSERREYACETDDDVNRKVKALINTKMTPIVCVGESLGVRDAETYVDFVTNQVRAALAGITPEQASRLAVAYEPIWAIGTGRTATPEQAQEVCSAIRQTVSDMFGPDCAEAIRILYGGSMKPENVEGLMAQGDIDGGLVGGASLDAKDFSYLIEACL